MALEDLIGELPAYAKDLKLNYSSLVKQNTELTPQQLWGTVVVAAIATRSAELTTEVIAEAEGDSEPGGAGGGEGRRGDHGDEQYLLPVSSPDHE